MRKVIYLLPLVFSSVFSHAQIGSPGGGGFLPFFGCNEACANIPVPGNNVAVKGMKTARDGFGGMVFCGSTETAGNRDFMAVRMMENGRPMTLFDGDGILTTDLGNVDDEAWGVEVQPDLKFVLAGFSGDDFAVVRYDNTFGTLDNTFGGTGIVKTDLGGGSVDKGLCMAIQSDGKILVAGFTDDAGSEDFAVVRYNPDGTLDLSFGGGDGIVITDIGANTVDVAFSIKVQTDGKILVAGATGNGTTFDMAVVRYNSNGTLDTSFDTDGKQKTNIGAIDVATRVDVQLDGKIVLGGYTGTGSYPGTNRDFILVRYSASGTPDATFDGDGVVRTHFAGITDAPAYSLYLLPNGKILLAGTNDGEDVLVAQYRKTGALDPEFDTDGWNTFSIGNANETNVACGDIFINDYGPDVQAVYFVGATANNGVGITSVIGSIISSLPIDLLSFNAQKQNSNILLQWQTEKEQNFAGFDIQRSADGKNFKTLGNTQPITTNGTIKKNYSYVDASPLSAVNYYRLAMRDLDGSTTFSKVLAIRNNSAGRNLEIFPNPIPVGGGVLQIQLPAGLRGRTNLQITDIVGRVVKSLIVETNGNPLATSIDVGLLGKGVYMIRARSDNNVSVISRFIKN